MGPAYFNEYQSRSDYYDEWLKEHLGKEDKLPPRAEERHQALLKLRQEAYQKLCDSVYKAKGYNLDAVPLRETLKKFDLLDDKADALLQDYGV
jgi:aldehyde:ferredoxin oxidoreductase